MAGTALLAYHFEYTDTFPVHIQGFFCYDSTYAKPYPGPEDASRAPPVLVYSLVTAVPTAMILVGELAGFLCWPRQRKEKTIVSGECCYFIPLLRRIVRFLGVYSFGLFTTTIFANAGQVVTGNQTPHFLSVCRPNYTALGCQLPGPQYITDRGACAGKPRPGHCSPQSLPLQGRRAQCLRRGLHRHVRDAGAGGAGLPAGQAHALPGAGRPGCPGGGGAGGRAPKPLG
ncbi:unnamed protein product [Lepidochelys kempii]